MKLMFRTWNVFAVFMLALNELSAQPLPPGPEGPIDDYIPHLLILGLLMCSLYMFYRMRKLQSRKL